MWEGPPDLNPTRDMSGTVGKSSKQFKNDYFIEFSSRLGLFFAFSGLTRNTGPLKIIWPESPDFSPNLEIYPVILQEVLIFLVESGVVTPYSVQVTQAWYNVFHGSGGKPSDLPGSFGTARSLVQTLSRPKFRKFIVCDSV